MAKSEQSRAEAETLIRWSELDEPATLWTASIAVRNEWRAYGFPVEVSGSGWGCKVDCSRISYKAMKKPSKIEAEK